LEPLRAIVYGIVQGLTEFLPVSSNAHLRLTPLLFGWNEPSEVFTAFTAVIQLGTTLAVLLYFRNDLKRVLGGWIASFKKGAPKDTVEAKMGWGVFYGTIPIVILGFLLKNHIETTFRSLYVIAAALILMGLVMFYFDRKPGGRDIETVTTKDGILVGLWQCLALAPGMSRSGSTISGARALGLDRVAAARFSFLLGIPSITLAGLYEAFKERHSIGGPLLMPTFIATAVSFAVGYASIAWMMKIVSRRGITPFVWYRLALGALLLVLLGTGRLHPFDGDQPAKTTESGQALSTNVP
jgi:undecaprenyl-diphosphatase